MSLATSARLAGIRCSSNVRSQATILVSTVSTSVPSRSKIHASGCTRLIAVEVSDYGCSLRAKGKASIPLGKVYVIASTGVVLDLARRASSRCRRGRSGRHSVDLSARAYHRLCHRAPESEAGVDVGLVVNAGPQPRLGELLLIRQQCRRVARK